jgi:DNA-binding response OmpR family regulator
MEKIKKTIMIADDDQGILDAVGMLLEYEGYDVVPVLDCKNLINGTHAVPDLLLLDIWMSGSDGRDSCKILKERVATSSLPIIMVSASKDIGPSAIAAGADDFLEKPFQINELLKKIEKFCV